MSRTPMQQPIRPPRAARGYTATEWLFIVVLILIIAGAGGLAIYHGLDGGPKATKAAPMRYQCQKCGHVLELTLGDLPPAKAVPTETGAPQPLDCPACDARGAALQMVTCPKCQKQYVPEAYRRPEQFAGGVRGGFVCPDCGTDWHKWSAERRKK
jgi:hypothetical protein